MGDFAIQAADHPEWNAEEKTRRGEARQELERLLDRWQAMYDKLQDHRHVPEMAERDKIGKEMREAEQRMAILNALVPRDRDVHGRVWLFKRKPKEAR